MSVQAILSKSSIKQQSVDGNSLRLDIIYHDTSNLCFEFIVRNVSVSFVDKQILIYVFVISGLLIAFNFLISYIIFFLFIIIGHLALKLLWDIKSGNFCYCFKTINFN